MGAPIDIQAIAAEAFALLDTGRQVAPFSSRLPVLNLDDAYRVTAAVRQMREACGEVVVGRKIGFTNRTIWAEYDVYAPIWGYVYDRTARDQINPPLAAGEIVTTGTLTRAFPVSPGETWTTELTGAALDGIRIRFV
jgi:2-keto-4-pentenoate hydratase